MRAATAVLVIVTALGVLLDPYTWCYNASDAVESAPLWQTLLGLGDVALLGIVAALAWKRSSRARSLLGGEILFALCALGILVGRDGTARFLAGYAGEEYLSLYLGGVALRIISFVMLSRASTVVEA